MTSPWKPVPKMTATALGGAAATLLVWLINAGTRLEVPAEAAAAFAVLFAFLCGYIKTPADAEHDDAGDIPIVELCLILLFLLVVLLVVGVIPTR